MIRRKISISGAVLILRMLNAVFASERAAADGGPSAPAHAELPPPPEKPS
jgi:hypothetical protein